MNSSALVDQRPSTALVLGATGGLGKAYCHALAKCSLHLIISGRNEQALQALSNELVAAYNVEVETHIADLSFEANVEKVMALIRGNERIARFVNATGLAQWGHYTEFSEASEQAMFQINLWVPIQLVRCAVEAFEQRNGGKVIQVASAAAFFPIPFLSGYCATKMAIVQWLRSIRQENHASKVYIQALCPGVVKTQMFSKAGANADRLPSWIWMSPERVVRESLRAVELNRTVCIPGRRYRMMIFGLKWVPSSISIFVAGRLFGNFSKYRVLES